MALGQTIRDNTPTPQFSQTAFIFGVVAVAFLIYVTLRGDLPKWFGLLTSSGQTAGPTTPAVNGVGSGSNVVPFPTLPTLPQLGTGAR